MSGALRRVADALKRVIGIQQELSHLKVMDVCRALNKKVVTLSMCFPVRGTCF